MVVYLLALALLVGLSTLLLFRERVLSVAAYKFHRVLLLAVVVRYSFLLPGCDAYPTSLDDATSALYF